MPVAIRAYRPEDFRTLWEIDQSCFPRGVSYSQAELRSYIRRPLAFTLVAEEQDDQASEKSDDASSGSETIVGFLVGERTARGTGHVVTIDVRQRGRRHGIGSALLDAAEQQLRASNCTAARLETSVDNVAALSFYKRHGYHVIRTIPRYYSNGIDALLLEKDLHSRHESGLH